MTCMACISTMNDKFCFQNARSKFANDFTELYQVTFL